MREFLENLPVNHWFSIFMLAISIIAFGYTIYFYFFSSEGKDERGRLIFAKASMVTFIVTVLVFVFYSVNLHLFTMEIRPVSFMLFFGMTLIIVIQALGIRLFKMFS